MTKQYRAELRDVNQQIRILKRNLAKARSDIALQTQELRYELRAVEKGVNRQLARLARRRGILQGRLS